MVETLEQSSEEGIWIPVGEHFEYWVEVNREVIRDGDYLDYLSAGIKDGSIKPVIRDRISMSGGAYRE